IGCTAPGLEGSRRADRGCGCCSATDPAQAKGCRRRPLLGAWASVTEKSYGSATTIEVLSKSSHRVLAVLAAAGVAASCSGPSSSREPAASPPPGQQVVVKISYGSEKKAWLTDSIEAFHRTGPRTGSGKPIRIEARAEGSTEAMDAILSGPTDLAVWSPASSLLVDVLNDRWAEAKGGLGAERKLVASAPPLVLSPVVIAVWEPMARALGWPGKAIGWSEVADFATASEG